MHTSQQKSKPNRPLTDGLGTECLDVVWHSFRECQLAFNLLISDDTHIKEQFQRSTTSRQCMRKVLPLTAADGDAGTRRRAHMSVITHFVQQVTLSSLPDVKSPQDCS